MSPEAEHPEPLHVDRRVEIEADLPRWSQYPAALPACEAAAELLAAVDRLTAAERERQAWHAAVVAFVDACCPTYSTDAADGPADLIPVLEDAADRLLSLTAENERLRTDNAEILAAGEDWIAWLDDLDTDPPEVRLVAALAAALPGVEPGHEDAVTP